MHSLDSCTVTSALWIQNRDLFFSVAWCTTNDNKSTIFIWYLLVKTNTLTVIQSDVDPFFVFHSVSHSSLIFHFALRFAFMKCMCMSHIAQRLSEWKRMAFHFGHDFWRALRNKRHDIHISGTHHQLAAQIFVCSRLSVERVEHANPSTTTKMTRQRLKIRFWN